MPAGPDTNSVRPSPDACSSDHPFDACEHGVAAQRRSHRPPDALRVRCVRGEQLGAQRGDGRARSDAELAAQRALEPLQLPQGSTPVAALGEPSRQRHARLLVGGIRPNEIGPPARAPQDLLEQLVQSVSRIGQPRLVRVIGQQVAGPQVRRGAGFGSSGAPVDHLSGATLEPLDVHDHIGVREQRHGVPGEDECPVVAECAPGVVRSLVQPGCSVVESCIGPQRVDDLLAVHCPTRRQCEELDQGHRVSAPPLSGGNGLPVHPDGEAAQQVDLDAHHPS